MHGESGARAEAHPLSLRMVLVVAGLALVMTMIADCLNLKDSVGQIEYLVCILEKRVICRCHVTFAGDW